MAIINIINEDGRNYDVLGSTNLAEVQNYQQKYAFASIVIKQKIKLSQTQNIYLKGTSLTNSITLPLLVNSSSAMLTSHSYSDSPYMHSNANAPVTYTPLDKGKQTITIKPRGSYVTDNTTGGSVSSGTTPYWS